MTTPIPSIPYDSGPVSLPFRDQRVGLRVIGIILIIIGAIAALFTLLMPLALIGSQSLSRGAARGGPPAPTFDIRMLIPAIIMYGIVAAYFLSLGIASVRIRRWVRPIVLVTGWPWLVMGVIGTIWWIIFSPAFTRSMQAAGGTGSPAMPAGVTTTIIVSTSVLMAVIFIVIPALLVWFYGNSHVRATLHYFDHHPSRTDGVPIPILGMGVWLVLSALSVLAAIFYPVVGLFGTILSGTPAIGVLVVFAAITLLLARETFHRRMVGWWGVIILISLSSISSLLTRLRHSSAELLEKAGYPEAQIKAAQTMDKSTVLGSDILWIVTILIAIAFIVYAKRYFKRDMQNDVPPLAPPVVQ